MAPVKADVIAIASADDVVRVRQTVRSWAIEIGFSLVEQTKLITAASELARNTVEHGGGGTMRIIQLDERRRRGLRLIFEDKGPGIADIARAMTDGFTTGKGLGLGLSGAKRLSNEFDIASSLGAGTTVTIARWKLI